VTSTERGVQWRLQAMNGTWAHSRFWGINEEDDGKRREWDDDDM
jgi:hypothetical protein